MQRTYPAGFAHSVYDLISGWKASEKPSYFKNAAWILNSSLTVLVSVFFGSLPQKETFENILKHTLCLTGFPPSNRLSWHLIWLSRSRTSNRRPGRRRLSIRQFDMPEVVVDWPYRRSGRCVSQVCELDFHLATWSSSNILSKHFEKNTKLKRRNFPTKRRKFPTKRRNLFWRSFRSSIISAFLRPTHASTRVSARKKWCHSSFKVAKTNVSPSFCSLLFKTS